MPPCIVKWRILDAWLDPNQIAGLRRGEIEMLELGIVILAVVGACWFFGALIGGLFKLAFGLVGVIFGGLFGLIVLSFVALMVLPIVFFALLPLLMPALFIVGLVWLIVHASRTHPAPPPKQGEAPTG
jgi:hypothetical protein